MNIKKETRKLVKDRTRELNGMELTSLFELDL